MLFSNAFKLACQSSNVNSTEECGPRYAGFEPVPGAAFGEGAWDQSEKRECGNCRAGKSRKHSLGGFAPLFLCLLFLVLVFFAFFRCS